MADTGIKISGLTEATSAADADVVAGVQSGTTKKFPLSVLLNYIKGKLTASDIGAQATITASGILKGDGSGGVSAAVAGTDYQAPLTAGTDYATPSALSATQQISALPLADPAAANIAAGKYVVYNNLLYLTNAAISSGETATSFASKIDAVPDGGLNALKAAMDVVAYPLSITTYGADYLTSISNCWAYRIGNIAIMQINAQFAATSSGWSSAYIEGAPPAKIGENVVCFTSNGQQTFALAVTTSGTIVKGSTNASLSGWYTGLFIYPVA